MPVSTGRVSSRDAERATLATVSTNAAPGTSTRPSPSGSGNGGKSSEAQRADVEGRRAADDLDVLLGRAQLERHARRRAARGRRRRAGAPAGRRRPRGRPRPRAARAGRSPCRWRAARSRRRAASSCTPDSAWTALRVDAARVTVCSWAKSASRRVVIFMRLLASRRRDRVIGINSVVIGAVHGVHKPRERRCGADARVHAAVDEPSKSVRRAGPHQPAAERLGEPADSLVGLAVGRRSARRCAGRRA